MAESYGLSGPAVLREVAALARRVASEVAHAADEVRGMPAGDHPMLAEFASAILERCKLVAANTRWDGHDDRPQEEAASPIPAPDEVPPSLGRP